LEVLVQEVMAAMTTAPWSSSKLLPSARVTGTRLVGRPMSAGTPSPYSCGSLAVLSSLWLGASEAGKVSATDSS
jgi:hypothetical protein